jgi:hypothetical protein
MNPAHTLKNLTVQISNKLSPIISNSFLIDGNVITNKESFFKEFAKKLQFPEYFGDNWGTLHIPTKIVNGCFGNGVERISRN